MTIEQVQGSAGVINVDDDWFRIRRASMARRLPIPVLRQMTTSDEYSTIDRHALPLMLECLDDTFHHDSAVFMPDHVPAPEPTAEAHDSLGLEENEHIEALEYFHPSLFSDTVSTQSPPVLEEDERVSSLYLLATILKFLQLNEQYRLVLAGHTDTTGDDANNYILAGLRAQNVWCLLEGDKGKWVDLCGQKSQVEDYQRVLLRYAATCSWSCDPGMLDGNHGPITDRAVRNFQKLYSATLNKRIAVDGIVGPQTWGAIFDLYQAEIASVLGTTIDELHDYRSNLRYVDDANPCISFGERHPIEAMGVDNFYSASNRRVEALLFHGDELPHIVRDSPADSCSAYGLAARFDAIIPVMRGSDPLEGVQAFEFVIESVEPFEQEEELESVFYGTHSDDEKWGFLDDFDEFYPGVGGARDLYDYPPDPPEV